ncbi:Fe(3+)-hydroxamate ABC transporter permease FhuB [Roseomonas sp. GC11]|uniref:Fe(3+)-hydroxamate ABC transporter permease FhuB n=1 Tax=Roseomonas sp. GC11 TaxID=2950546 RepID=UPI00210C57CB|nr:Fe(3+)-hydroxamate ABC transporter permease FhuB [Roseomonas sp. GC11]MCQ4161666.1 Fe(3+)-hydroxamate ABC transporter permease FhuB [Roseomonas sp. GC11]
MPEFRLRRPFPVVALLLACALFLTLRQMAALVPPGLWWDLLLRGADLPDPAPGGAPALGPLLLHSLFLPRVAMSLLCGAALAFAGVLLQQVLRNPMAEPATLGVAPGAALALALAAVLAPDLLLPAPLGLGRVPVAFLGGMAALGLVLLLSAARGFAPLAVILAGMVVSLACGAMAALVTLFRHDLLLGLFFWGAGALEQRGWDGVRSLGLWSGAVGLAVLPLRRPLALLALGDEGAQGLGLGVGRLRLLGLGLAVLLSAAVVSQVGVVSFIGLATPALARLLGLRRLGERLFWGALLGGGLLWLTDQLVLLIPQGYRTLPTGAMAGFLGAPLLLVLLPRLPATPPPALSRGDLQPVRHRLLPALGPLLLGTPLLLWLAMAAGQDAAGWHWASGDMLHDLLPWRLPRALAALSAGILMALAGTLTQRLTGNPMAAPEVLGISSGAALGVIVMLFTLPLPSRGGQMLAGAAGAAIVLAVMLGLGRRSGFSPERLILVGIALTALLGTATGLVMASGDPRAVELLNWMSGSTYAMELPDAFFLLLAAVLGLGLLVPLARWLDILPLGEVTALGLGLPLPMVRLCLLLLVAAMTSVAMLVVGPLSFTGLLAPQIAHRLGLGRGWHQALGAAMIGGNITLLADWFGRMLDFPFQIPAGLLVSVLGGPLMIWLMLRRPG